MKKFLIPIFFALTIFSPVKANIDREVAEMCMKAVDFKGCIETMSGQTNKKSNSTYENNQEIEVKAPPEHSFEQDSVLQLKIRGRYGRYITFKGRTKVSYKGTDSYTIGGGVGNTVCYGSTCSTYYTPPTTIPNKIQYNQKVLDIVSFPFQTFTMIFSSDSTFLFFFMELLFIFS